VILTITGLLVVAMVLPVLWGLYFGGIKQNSIWWSTGIAIIVAILLKKFTPTQSSNTFIKFYLDHIKVIEVFIGLLVPIIVLLVLEFSSTAISAGYLAIKQKITENFTGEPESDHQLAVFPATLLAYSIGALSLVMFGLMLFTNEKARLLIGGFAFVLLGLGIMIWLSVKISSKKIKKI
jgi:hypothetical protein